MSFNGESKWKYLLVWRKPDDSVVSVYYSGGKYLIEDQDCRDVRVLSQTFQHLIVKPVARPLVCRVHHDYHWEWTVPIMSPWNSALYFTLCVKSKRNCSSASTNKKAQCKFMSYLGRLLWLCSRDPRAETSPAGVCGNIGPFIHCTE